ncbi:MAG: hypothetical protein ABFD24_03285 [Anaerolineaceae bacterium]
MVFKNVAEAIHTQEDLAADAEVRCQAKQYLESLDECFELKSLVNALQSDDLGVRWEASNLLIKLGQDAIPEILKALMDQKRVNNVNLRQSALHILHSIQTKDIQGRFTPLINALKYPEPVIETMEAAYKLSKELGIKGCMEEKEHDKKQ